MDFFINLLEQNGCLFSKEYIMIALPFYLMVVLLTLSIRLIIPIYCISFKRQEALKAYTGLPF